MRVPPHGIRSLIDAGMLGGRHLNPQDQLLGSPLAKGLFHRAILESGTGTMLVQRRADAEATGLRIATTLGITGTACGMPQHPRKAGNM